MWRDTFHFVMIVLYFAVANGGPAPHCRGSDSISSAYSWSSSPPLSSLSGLSQVLFPPAFASEMVDVAVSTEDHTRRLSNAKGTANTAVQTDPQPLSNWSHPGSPVATETSRTVGATVMLKDTAIRGKGEGPKKEGGNWERTRAGTWEMSSKKPEVGKHSPKTAALMAFTKPRQPIRRSQSHSTASGEADQCLDSGSSFELHIHIYLYVIYLNEKWIRTHTHSLLQASVFTFMRIQTYRQWEPRKADWTLVVLVVQAGIHQRHRGSFLSGRFTAGNRVADWKTNKQSILEVWLIKLKLHELQSLGFPHKDVALKKSPFPARSW